MKPIKHVTCKVFPPTGGAGLAQVFHAPNGHHFQDDGVRDITNRMADVIEKTYPGVDYRMIEVGRGQFNFVPIVEG